MKIVDTIALMILTGFIAFAAGIYFGHEYSFTDGYEYAESLVIADAKKAALKEVEAEMLKNCVCWFSDSRCKAERPILACKAPDFYRR